MSGLINVNVLGEIGVKLLDKLADGIRWIVAKGNPQKIAIDTYIKEIQKENYDSLQKAALISNTNKIVKEYCNQNDIVKIAI